MKPDARAAQRFFEGLTEVCPVAELDHIHLVHWTTELPSPVEILTPLGFKGTLVAGRQSIFQRFNDHQPRIERKLDDHPSAGVASAGILMELMPGKEATRFAIQRALSCLQPGKHLWVFGSREDGIASLQTLFPKAETVYYKGHLRLVALKAEEGELPQQEEFQSMVVNGVELATRPGLFSWNRPDPASLLLLETITSTPGERLLDFGCGNGLLGITLAKQWPECQVVMSDDLYSAVKCCQQSIAINQLEKRCQVVAENGIGQQLSRMRFNTIVSNPPFHRGTRSDYQIARQFITSATNILAPGGELRLVGSRFLDYGGIMATLLKGVEPIQQEDNFVVWRAFRSNKP
ncbi:MAG: class I SAM-dependent methyltransferase [Magnetococcales bacterium]|nr:class I SAM-dependent methyltransferase [Magnetococcales bacterium]NGZ25853.1 class I SAM-dependent methyltransferase [Magnetococcales bacterium]